MPDSFTANLNFVKPEVGASRDSWGAKWNQNLDQIDTILFAAIPIGALFDYAGANAPAGWLLCDGLQYSVSAYPSLFAVIGNRYGGDGVTTFAVPDFRARGSAGVGTGTDMAGFSVSYSLGQKWGWYQIAITQGNLPNYQLPETSDGNHQHNGYGVTDAQGDHQHGGATDGSGQHSHLYPRSNQGLAAAFGTNVTLDSRTHFGESMPNTTDDGFHAHNILTDIHGIHQHNVAVTTSAGQGGHYHAPFLGGSGVPLWMVDPKLAVTKMIFAGPPPTPRAMNAQQPPPLAMMTPLRGMH